MTANAAQAEVNADNAMPRYETPSIRVMDESEVLSAFQVTVAGLSWWTM
jgi:hypothetical protein